MSDILISLGKSTVQLAADLAHIPGLTPALNILTDIIKSCQNVSTNKYILAYDIT
jgi:hypothetical protein